MYLPICPPLSDPCFAEIRKKSKIGHTQGLRPLRMPNFRESPFPHKRGSLPANCLMDLLR